MYLKIENCADRSERIIDYPGNVRLFLSLHSMGIFQPVIISSGKAWGLVDRFTGEIHTLITKPSKKEIAAYKREVATNEINEKAN